MKPTANTPLLLAKEGQCRWIVEGTEGAYAFVCGEPAKLGSSYCPHHRSLVYVPARQFYAKGFNLHSDESIKADGDTDREPDLTEVFS